MTQVRTRREQAGHAGSTAAVMALVAVMAILLVLALFGDALWSRAAAALATGFSTALHFVWVPRYPLWAVLPIAAGALGIRAVWTGGHRPSPA